MRPNNVSETHAESGDPLILDEAETGPLIPFKLVCAEIGIGRRTGGRRVPTPALVNLADLDRMRGQNQEGTELLRKAMSIDPNNADIRHSSGPSVRAMNLSPSRENVVVTS